MNFHVMTLFPEMIMQGLNVSIIGRAIEKGLISIEAVNIRDYAFNKHNKVDDYIYGGGAGMLMQAEPVYLCYEAIRERITSGSRPRVVYLTPQGEVFTQKKAQELAKEDDLILLCGHYEGIDERVLEEIVTDNISIGDYVLTGGELAAMVLIDVVARMLPGCLSDTDAAKEESIYSGLLEYDQYTKPREYEGMTVPEVLFNGNHKLIHLWQYENSLRKTKELRPDLFKKYIESKKSLTKEEKKILDSVFS